MASWSWKAGLAGIAVITTAAYAIAQMHGYESTPGSMGLAQDGSRGHMHRMMRDMSGHRMMHMALGEHAHSGEHKGDNGPSSLAFQAINSKMHTAMDITFTGNADIDFIKGMIPHHQGAVDMAKTVLAFGKDAEVRKLAEDVIKAQEAEIAWMTEWLKKQERP
jgi:uncharacterized protein (DUF305 family)